jgi:hypothetical protein
LSEADFELVGVMVVNKVNWGLVAGTGQAWSLRRSRAFRELTWRLQRLTPAKLPSLPDTAWAKKDRLPSVRARIVETKRKLSGSLEKLLLLYLYFFVTMLPFLSSFSSISSSFVVFLLCFTQANFSWSSAFFGQRMFVVSHVNLPLAKVIFWDWQHSKIQKLGTSCVLLV